jgi:hypothetical protein
MSHFFSDAISDMHRASAALRLCAPFFLADFPHPATLGAPTSPQGEVKIQFGSFEDCNRLTVTVKGKVHFLRM